MKIQILSDLQSEIERLFIAGGKFATGDPRLAKLIPTLEKMGEKTPVMKKLAAMTSELVKSKTPETTLADLGVFLNAILNTQGEITSNDLTPVELIPFFEEVPQTLTPYSTLEPVITALTTTGQSRASIIRNAHENGSLSDFRLYSLLSRGLSDKSAEVAQFLADTAIPSLGDVMIPFLLSDYDVNGKTADARRLKLLDVLEYENVLEMAEEAVNKGSTVVQLEAIEILGQDTKHEELLLAYIKDKKKRFREAALVGLVRMNSTKGKERMVQILSSEDPSYAITAAKKCKDPEYNRKIFDLVKQSFDENIKGKKFKVYGNFISLLYALQGKDEDYIFEFLGSIYSLLSTELDIQTYSDLLFHIKAVLDDNPNEKAVLSVYEQIAKQTVLTENPPFNLSHIYYENFASYYYFQALKFHTPQEIYDIFAPYYTYKFIKHNPKSMLSPKCFNEGIEVDTRWIDTFYKAGDIFAIANLASRVDAPEYIQHKSIWRLRDYFSAQLMNK